MRFLGIESRLCAKENYDSLVSKMVEDLHRLQTEGFEYMGEQWFLVVTGIKGDQPFLRKTGALERHWQRAKRAENGKDAGVCWLCMAGCPGGGHYEDFNLNARWWSARVEEPWKSRPSVLQLHHSPSKPQECFRPDIWHNWHGGFGKTFLGSALAEALMLLPGSREKRIEAMAGHLRAWSRLADNRMPASGDFCAERIGLSSYQVLPEASYSKHDDTRIYLNFLETFLEEHNAQVQECEVLCKVLDACQSINRCFRILYNGGLWLEKQESHDAGTLGRRFLRRYAELAAIFMARKKLRFPIYVKAHMMDHHFRRMLVRSSRSDWCLNELVDSVQMDEDLVGHVARMSRRVSPVTTAYRVLQRYLLRTHRAWGSG